MHRQPQTKATGNPQSSNAISHQVAVSRRGFGVFEWPKAVSMLALGVILTSCGFNLPEAVGNSPAAFEERFEAGVSLDGAQASKDFQAYCFDNFPIEQAMIMRLENDGFKNLFDTDIWQKPGKALQIQFNRDLSGALSSCEMRFLSSDDAETMRSGFEENLNDPSLGSISLTQKTNSQGGSRLIASNTQDIENLPIIEPTEPRDRFEYKITISK